MHVLGSKNLSVIQVRCGRLNSRLKSGVPKHTVDVSMLTEVNGVLIFGYIRRRVSHRERNE